MLFHKEYTLSVPVSDKDHIQGKNDAPITLVEYGDYQCPYCGQAYPIVKQIQENFGDNLRFVFRNFPLSEMHQYAFGAAEAAEVADDYGKFWEMHDMLYEHQDQLSESHLIDYASQLGIDPKEFRTKLESNSKAQRVKDDFMSGVESGVNGTPSFYINNRKYEGAWDYESLKTILSELI